MEMHAISLWQPYASLIAIGAKPYETRHWSPPPNLIGKRIAIHAAARKPTQAELDDMQFDVEEAFGFCHWHLRIPYGAVVCTATLDAAFQLGERAENTNWSAARVVKRMTTRVMPECFTVRYDNFGDYSPGRWAWLLKNIEPLKEPVPAKGKQGWWKWETS